MSNDFAFQSQARGPRMPRIISPKAGETIEAICLSTEILETHSHFFKRTSYPCQGRGEGACPFKHTIHPPRRKYYLAGLKLPGRARCLIEITDHSYDWLFQDKAPGPWMRGKIVRLTRGRHNNSAVVGKFRDPMISREALNGKEPTINIVQCLLSLWGNVDTLDQAEMGKQADTTWFAGRDAMDDALDPAIPG